MATELKDIFVTAWIESGKKPLLFAKLVDAASEAPNVNIENIFGVFYVVEKGPSDLASQGWVSIWDEEKGWAIRDLKHQLYIPNSRHIFVRPAHFDDSDCLALEKHLPQVQPLDKFNASYSPPTDKKSSPSLGNSSLSIRQDLPVAPKQPAHAIVYRSNDSSHADKEGLGIIRTISSTSKKTEPPLEFKDEFIACESTPSEGREKESLDVENDSARVEQPSTPYPNEPFELVSHQSKHPRDSCSFRSCQKSPKEKIREPASRNDPLCWVENACFATPLQAAIAQHFINSSNVEWVRENVLIDRLCLVIWSDEMLASLYDFGNNQELRPFLHEALESLEEQKYVTSVEFEEAFWYFKGEEAIALMPQLQVELKKLQRGYARGTLARGPASKA